MIPGLLATTYTRDNFGPLMDRQAACDQGTRRELDPSLVHRTSIIFYAAKGRLRLMFPTNRNQSVTRKSPAIAGEHENISQQIPAHTRDYPNFPGCQETYFYPIFSGKAPSLSTALFQIDRPHAAGRELINSAGRLTRGNIEHGVSRDSAVSN